MATYKCLHFCPSPVHQPTDKSCNHCKTCESWQKTRHTPGVSERAFKEYLALNLGTDYRNIADLSFHNPEVANSFKEHAYQKMHQEFMNWRERKLRRKCAISRLLFRACNSRRGWESNLLKGREEWIDNRVLKGRVGC